MVKNKGKYTDQSEVDSLDTTSFEAGLLSPFVFFAKIYLSMSAMGAEDESGTVTVREEGACAEVKAAEITPQKTDGHYSLAPASNQKTVSGHV